MTGSTEIIKAGTNTGRLDAVLRLGGWRRVTEPSGRFPFSSDRTIRSAADSAFTDDFLRRFFSAGLFSLRYLVCHRGGDSFQRGGRAANADSLDDADIFGSDGIESGLASAG